MREYSYEAPLVEEEICLLEEEVLPVIVHFLERSDPIAAAREAWAEKQVRAEEFELEPGQAHPFPLRPPRRIVIVKIDKEPSWLRPCQET